MGAVGPDGVVGAPHLLRRRELGSDALSGFVLGEPSGDHPGQLRLVVTGGDDDPVERLGARALVEQRDGDDSERRRSGRLEVDEPSGDRDADVRVHNGVERGAGGLVREDEGAQLRAVEQALVVEHPGAEAVAQRLPRRTVGGLGGVRQLVRVGRRHAERGKPVEHVALSGRDAARQHDPAHTPGRFLKVRRLHSSRPASSAPRRRCSTRGTVGTATAVRCCGSGIACRRAGRDRRPRRGSAPCSAARALQ